MTSPSRGVETCSVPQFTYRPYPEVQLERNRDSLSIVGAVAGIGFTMAIFIANLAYEDAHLLATAKVAVLVASLAAGVVSSVAGKMLLPKTPDDDCASTPAEAEASVEL